MFKPRMWILVVLIIVALGATLSLPGYAQQGRGEGYWYTVRPGDSWWSISVQTGIPVGALQAANPQAIRPNLWLWQGERLWIPTGQVTRQRGYWYIVQPGDSWLDLAIRTGVSVSVLKRLNPQAIHPNDWMWAGDRIFIPTSAVPEAPAASPTPTSAAPPAEATPTAPPATPAVAASPTPTLAAKPGHEPTVALTPAASPEANRPSSSPSSTPETAAQPPSAPTIDVPCPATEDNLGDVLTTVLVASKGRAESVQSWLASCSQTSEATTTVAFADINGDGQPDAVLAVPRLDSDSQAQTVVYIYVAQGEKYAPVYTQTLAGTAQVLAVKDLNEDGHTDMVLEVKTCDANACITTVKVLSWQDQDTGLVAFSEGEISMPNATVRLEDTTSDPGLEIVLHGGVIEAIGAGPQRSWTEVWASKNGGPYQLVARRYDPSPCLYHWVLDGNQALKEGRFDEAIAIFQKVVSDPDLEACWLRPDEEEELRTFGWFRLALSYAYAGQPDMVGTVVQQAEQVYPDTPYVQALGVWYQTYRTTQDARKACEALQPLIERNPILWEMLSDYGYANPTFGPGDVCPLVKTAEKESASKACPENLDEAANKMQALLDASPGDIMALYSFARDCGYVGDAYGGVGAQDVDGDGSEEIFVAINLPAQNEKGSAGPGVLVAFTAQDDTYTPTFQQPFSDTVTLLALEDLNQDGHADVAWKTSHCVEAETTSCQVEAHVASWTGEGFESWIKGPAVGHNARVEFADKGPGSGQELLLIENAYADTPSQVPERTQIWASDSGKPYTLFDVTYGATTCARYALDEADVAFRTAQQFGWDRVFSRLQKVLNDDTLTTCKPGVAPEKELATVRSFASLRLMQAYVYTGQLDAAEKALSNMVSVWPDSPFTTLAQQWWRIIEDTGDINQACQKLVAAVQSDPMVLDALHGYPVENLHPMDAEEMCPSQP